MKLKKFKIKNFRGYKEKEVEISDFTTLVGQNDVGKSTIFEAMDIFFENSKMQKDDRRINSSEDVELIGYFDDLPSSVKLESVSTRLQDEFLTLKNDNESDLLVLKQKYTGEKLSTMSEYIVSSFPSTEEVKNIHSLKITELRKKYSDLIENVDKRKSTDIRKIVLKHYADNYGLEVDEIKLSNKSTTMKDITGAIHNNLPMYQLFKADRNNTDTDSEIQDPIKAIIKTALKSNEIQKKLDSITNEVNLAVSQITGETLSMLKDMNETLAKDLSPNFQTPNWSKVFNLGLETESGIPLNKRGSGVRRLILLNFFRAEARRQLVLSESNQDKELNLIYAFEEPETSQHPNYQKMLIDSFYEMSQSNNIQVLITTHSPSIANIVPIDGIRLIKKKNNEVEILSREAAIDEVIDQLGLIKNIKIYPDQLETLVLVEGPTDVEVFQHVYDELSNKNEYEKNKLIFLQGGGSAIVNILNKRIVEKMNLKKKFMILDGDKSGNDDINKIDDKSVKPIQLRKSTIEFYMPYEYVKDALKHHQNPMKSSKEEWEKGEDESKLTKGQKRFLNKNGSYGNFNVYECSTDVIEEFKMIVKQLDADD